MSRLAIVTLMVGAGLVWGAQGAEAINCDSRRTCSTFLHDNSCDQNGGHGMAVSGGNNFLAKNICSYNDGDGLLVEGTATLQDNQARTNGDRGVFAP